ncbi:MAG: hypothetical protein JWP91_95 [Fibrobacteres bacterium]|nr:hypothetical protein [Fibrobacterota bacterium]
MAKNIQIQVATEGLFVPMKILKGKEKAFTDLMKGAAELVRTTEPNTLQWFALHEKEDRYAIADFFTDAKGREDHFAGQVAMALKKAAPDTLEGGWERGVVAHAEPCRILASSILDDDIHRARFAQRLPILAKPGKEEELAAFLTDGVESIRMEEPGTLLWYGLRVNGTRFTLFDVFASEEGKAAHLAGEFAGTLKDRAGDLIQGGWDKGVLANIRNYQILASTY